MPPHVYPQSPDYLELADSVAPHNYGYRMDHAAVTMPFILAMSKVPLEFRRQILGLIGYNFLSNDGRITRVLPVQCPGDPSLYAASVNLVGFGVPEPLPSPTEAEPDEPLWVEEAEVDRHFRFPDQARQVPVRPRGTPVAPEFAMYPYFTGTVEFTRRPYQIAPDDQIAIEDGSFFNDKGEEAPFQYAREWERYCEVDEVFDPKIISATQGQLVFFTDDGSQPHRQAFAGTPRIPFPETMLTIRWHQVPYSFISSRNSYLKRFAMRVNQRPWDLQDYHFEPGELLYLGPKYTRYTPPLPMLYQITFGEPPARFLFEKWATVELTFMYVQREAPNPPADLKGNWIARGHNCLPWFGTRFSKGGRKPHYVASFDEADPDNRENWQPIFDSFPVELLFTDPDFPQPT